MEQGHGSEHVSVSQRVSYVAVSEHGHDDEYVDLFFMCFTLIDLSLLTFRNKDSSLLKLSTVLPKN